MRKHTLLLILVLFGSSSFSEDRGLPSEIEFGVSEGGLQKLFQAAIGPASNPHTRASAIPGLHFLRESRLIMLTNLPETHPKYPSPPRVLNPANESDLQVRVDSGRVTASLSPTEIRIQSDKPIDFKIPGPKEVKISYGDGDFIPIELEKVKVRVNRLFFHSSHGGAKFTTELKLNPQNGVLVIDQEKTAMKLIPNRYDLEFGDLDIDFEIPGFRKDSKAYKAAAAVLTDMARDHMRKDKAAFSAHLENGIRGYIEGELNAALENSINPALKRIERVHVLDEVKDALSFVPGTPGNPNLFGILQAQKCARSSPERRLQMEDNEVVVGFNEDSVNRILASPGVALDSFVLDKNTGSKFINKERPRVRIVDGHVYASIHGEYRSGISSTNSPTTNVVSQVEGKFKNLVGVNRAEGKIVAEVKPVMENGKLQLLLQEVHAMDMRVYSADGKKKTEGVQTRFERISDEEVQVVVGQSSFDELLESLTQRGALAKDSRFRMLKTPKLKLENGEVVADVSVLLQTSLFPDIKKDIDKRIVGPDGKPPTMFDLTTSAKVRPEVVVDPKTGKKYLQLDLVEIREMKTSITKTDPKTVKVGFWESVGSVLILWKKPSTSVAIELSEKERTLKTMAISKIRNEIRKRNQPGSTNVISGLEFSLPVTPVTNAPTRIVVPPPNGAALLLNTSGGMNVPYQQLVGVNSPGSVAVPSPPKPKPDAVMRMRIDTQDPNFKHYFSVPLDQMGNQYDLDRIVIDGSEARMVWKVKKLKEEHTPLLSSDAQDLARAVVDPTYARIFSSIVGGSSTGTRGLGFLNAEENDPPELEPSSVKVIGDQLQLGIKLNDDYRPFKIPQ